MSINNSIQLKKYGKMICTWESRYSFPSLSYTLKTTGRQESHLTLTITSLTSYTKLAAIT